MKVAAIDIGSNSVRLLVVDVDGTEITRDTTVTALGTDLERTGSFDAGTYAATVDVMERYAATIAGLHVEEVRAVATSAARDASNGGALMEDIRRVLGVEPVIIDGGREAALAFAGATRDMAGDRTRLIIDIGGGSTEFVSGVGYPSSAVSVDMGSVRLTDRCFGDRPVADDQVQRARSEADAAFASVGMCSGVERAIGIAGTFTTLAAIALRLDTYDAQAVHGSKLDVDVVSSLVDWFALLSLSETALIPSLEPARARAILGGAIVAERALLHCGIESITVSQQGLLDGLAFEGATP